MCRNRIVFDIMGHVLHNVFKAMRHGDSGHGKKAATRDGEALSGDRNAQTPPVSTPHRGAPAAANPLPKIQNRNTEMQLCL